MATETTAPTETRWCHVVGCIRRSGELYFCGKHWMLLDHKLRFELFDNYVLGQEVNPLLMTDDYREVLARCAVSIQAKEART